MGQYFTADTDRAIASFKNTDNVLEKNKIFDAEIRPAFEKLIENLIYVYRYYNIDDTETLKNDCLANLYENINKFDPNRGTKGFSYFNVVAKNWFIYKSREKANRSRTDIQFDGDEMSDDDTGLNLSAHEKDLSQREFWLEFYSEVESWRDLLEKPQERAILEAIIFIMRNNHLVSIFSKKAVYLYLREMTGLNPKQVVHNLKKILDLYANWKKNRA